VAAAPANSTLVRPIAENAPLMCSSLNSTLRTILARLHVSDTDGFPSRGILTVIAIYRHLFLTKAQNHRGRHSTPFADTASMNSRDSSSPASFHSKIIYRRPQFRQLVQGARLGSSFHGINALRSNSDIASALVWNFPSCSSQWASSSITNIQLPLRVETGYYTNHRLE
jgi:hypothetical protein